MKTLMLSCNVRSPYAGLVEDGQLVSIVPEADYVELVDPYTVFPENAVARVVGGAQQVDQVVFVGKPFLFLERLASLHAYLFPRSYRAFSRDLHTYIQTAMRIPSLVKKAVEENDLIATVNCEPCYYVRLDEALADAAECDDNTMIITCLTDTFEGPSFCCFERRQGKTRLVKELDPANSFANLLRIQSEFAGRVLLDGLVDLCDDRVFTFRKSCVDVRGNAFIPKGAPASGEGIHDASNIRLLVAVLSRLLSPFAGVYGGIIFLSDVPLPPAVVDALPSVAFGVVDPSTRLAAVHQYFQKRLEQPA